MAADPDLLRRVRALLADLPDVEEKKMFGGIAFMVRGKMCVSVGAKRIMCRIDPAAHDRAIAHEGCSTVVMKSRDYRGYVHVDSAVLGASRELHRWIHLALDYNEKAFSKS